MLFPELAHMRLRRGGLPPRVGGLCLGVGSVAGITLWGTYLSARTSIRRRISLLHELRHVQQFQADPLFPVRYVWETVRRGYARNRYELECRVVRCVPSRSSSQPGVVTVVQHTDTSVVTIDRFIVEQERLHPEATGDLSRILYDLALAAKMIANKVRRAGLADVLGEIEMTNVQGETQQKLDVLANTILIKALDHGGRSAAMASEEETDIIQIPDKFRAGKYVLLFDPLDGSSNIDVNVPVGTIFSVLRKTSRGPRGELSDMLQPGRQQVAAGYVIYGSSTMLVYSTGQGVHGFTLDPSLGEFLLSHDNIRTPARGRYLSVNDSYESMWDEPTRALIRKYRGMDGDR